MVTLLLSDYIQLHTDEVWDEVDFLTPWSQVENSPQDSKVW